MKSPYRISAKEVDPEPRSAGPRSYAVLICIALGVIVQLVGLITHGLDAFGHLAFAFAFGLGTAGLQAGSKSPHPLNERSDGERSGGDVDDRGSRELHADDAHEREGRDVDTVEERPGHR